MARHEFARMASVCSNAVSRQGVCGASGTCGIPGTPIQICASDQELSKVSPDSPGFGAMNMCCADSPTPHERTTGKGEEQALNEAVRGIAVPRQGNCRLLAAGKFLPLTEGLPTGHPFASSPVGRSTD
jgi:hypothetical protein